MKGSLYGTRARIHLDMVRKEEKKNTEQESSAPSELIPTSQYILASSFQWRSRIKGNFISAL